MSKNIAPPPFRPEDSLLAETAPLELWQLALAQAEHSNIKTFRTGVVMWDPKKGILSRGFSRYLREDALDTQHAECHAIERGPCLQGAECLVVTIGARGGWSWSSCPCTMCAQSLKTAGVANVTWAQRDDSDVWTVQSLPLADIEVLPSPSDLSTGKERFARYQRMPEHLIVPACCS